MNLSLFKFNVSREPVWLVQGVSALAGLSAAVASGGDWRSYIPAVLTALSAPLLRSRVMPVQKVADLVNVALHTPAPGGGPKPNIAQTVQDAEAIIKDVKAAAQAAGLVTVTTPSAPAGPTVLPPQH
jgi:hypothetical protein